MIVKAAEKMEFAVVPSGLFGWIVKGRKKMKALAMAKVAAVIVALLGVLAGAVAAEVPAPVPSDMGDVCRVDEARHPDGHRGQGQEHP